MLTAEQLLRNLEHCARNKMRLWILSEVLRYAIPATCSTWHLDCEALLTY